jgi:chloramphenicol 3-O phosphotransferase
MRLPDTIAKMEPGNVIFLNGSSSAGKTTIAKKLQQLLPEPYQHIALDQFRDGMADRYRGLNSPPATPGALGLNVVPTEIAGERVTEVRFGELGEKMLYGMRMAMAAFARSGHHVIIDDLLFLPGYFESYVRLFSGIPVWFIGVRCALDAVNAREASRPGRFPGTAISHFDQVHAHGGDYDLEVDTTHDSPRRCAEQIIDRLARPPLAFDRFRRAIVATEAGPDTPSDAAT